MFGAYKYKCRLEKTQRLARKESKAGYKKILRRARKDPRRQARNYSKAGYKRLQGRLEKTTGQARKDSKAG